MTILIRRDPKIAAMFDLFAPDPDDPNLLPPSWNGVHVGQRLVEGFDTLLKQQTRGGPRAGMGSAWPKYMYEFDDLIAQAEQGELQRTMERQNSVRFIPSATEIMRMEASTYWPIKYLREKPELCVAVNAVALAHALGRDAGWVAKKRGGYADTWREGHGLGIVIIAAGLVRDRVAAF